MEIRRDVGARSRAEDDNRGFSGEVQKSGPNQTGAVSVDNQFVSRKGGPAASEAQTGIGRNESNYRSKRKKKSYTASWMASIRAVTLWRIRYVNVAFHRAFRAVPER
jgi:hypothetical protein